jgi:hypothetical protein
MNTFSSANWLSVSVRIYRALLVAYPKKFREHYETHMVQVFRDSFRYEYHRNGISGVIDLWLHTFADLLVTALMERLMERSQYMFSPKVILWGGVASMFSGMLWMMMGLAQGGSVLFWLITWLAPTGALVLGLGGLAGLYSRQSEQGGRLGLAGFALGIIGTLLALAAVWWGPTINLARVARDPTFDASSFLIFSLAMVLLGVGIMLLGVTSLRGKALHRWRGLPLGLGLLNTLGGMTFWLAFYLPLSQGQNPWKQWSLIEGYVLYHAVTALLGLGVLLGLGWIGLGIMLATESNAQVIQPPVSA